MSSAGQEAIELAASAGLILDPWEADCLDHALGEREDGKWSAFEVGLIVPRQNGKGSVLEARELAGLYLFDEALILHSAHEFKTASEAFRRILSLIENTPDLERRVKRILRSHGDEGIELKTGQRLRFVARSTGSGRGFSGDTVILDESYNLSAQALAALLPTMAARPNPQLWYTSSAPLERGESDVLRALCKRGREGKSPSLAYMEFCAGPEPDLNDRAEWQAANPGFGIRISEEFIEREREALDPEDFARERLGIWHETDSTKHAIPPADWAACQNPKSEPSGDLSFALDVSPDRASASFAVAGASTLGGAHIEVVDHRPGTGWVADRAVELQKRWGGVLVLAQNSPAWSLESVLTQAGLVLAPMSVPEHAQACGQLFDAVVEHRVHHLGQAELTRAVGGAASRPYGDAWLWSRKSSAVDISPLVAATLALSHANRALEHEEPAGYFSMKDLTG